MMHGLPKIQNAFAWMGPDSWAPPFLQAMAAFAEFGGGLALVLGLLTPLAALGVLCVMATAILSVHVPHGDPFVKGPGTPGGSYELAAIYGAAAFLLMLLGPGRFSLDAILFKRAEIVINEREMVSETTSSSI
jgi:putative oxidoreductase